MSADWTTVPAGRDICVFWLGKMKEPAGGGSVLRITSAARGAAMPSCPRDTIWLLWVAEKPDTCQCGQKAAVDGPSLSAVCPHLEPRTWV